MIISFFSKILTKITGATNCGTHFIQMENSALKTEPKDYIKFNSREEKIALFERMGFSKKVILDHFDKKLP